MTTRDESIEESIEAIFKKVLNQNSFVLQRNLTASQVEGWDSLANIQIIVGVQEAFKIKFSGGDALRLKNIGDLVDFVKVKISAPGTK